MAKFEAEMERLCKQQEEDVLSYASLFPQQRDYSSLDRLRIYADPNLADVNS